MSEQETRKKIQRLAKNSIKLFKGLEGTRTTLPTNSHETRKNVSTRCKNLAEDNRFKPCNKFGGFFGRKIQRRVTQGSGELPFSANFISPAKLFFFVAAQELVALDGGDYADGTFVARLGALHAAEAAYADGACQSDLVGQGEKNFNG